MMKAGLLVFIFLLLMNHHGLAQETKRDKKYFASQISSGILEGGQGTSFHIETINGVRYKTWFAGIGAGLDNYYFRSIPVYLSAVKYISQGNHSFYVQGDVGLNLAWENDQLRSWNEVSDQFKPGFYWNSSFGFATGLDKKNSFLFGLGYSQKYLKEVKETTVQCFNPPCQNSEETYIYSLKRVSVKLGWQFNNKR